MMTRVDDCSERCSGHRPPFIDFARARASLEICFRHPISSNPDRIGRASRHVEMHQVRPKGCRIREGCRIRGTANYCCRKGSEPLSHQAALIGIERKLTMNVRHNYNLVELKIC